jgi:hypothetical protein
MARRIVGTGGGWRGDGVAAGAGHLVRPDGGSAAAPTAR